MSPIVFALCVVFAIVFGLTLFKIGESNKLNRKILFYIFAILFSIALIHSTLSLIKIVISLTFFMSYYFIFIIYLIERIFWIFALKDSAEYDKLKWFFMILFVPILGWLIYRIIEK